MITRERGYLDRAVSHVRDETALSHAEWWRGPRTAHGREEWLVQ